MSSDSILPHFYPPPPIWVLSAVLELFPSRAALGALRRPPSLTVCLTPQASITLVLHCVPRLRPSWATVGCCPPSSPLSLSVSNSLWLTSSTSSWLSAACSPTSTHRESASSFSTTRPSQGPARALEPLLSSALNAQGPKSPPTFTSK